MSWLLLVVMAWPGSGAYTTKAVFHSRKDCFEALSKVKLYAPNASENEWGFKAICILEKDHKKNYLNR